MEIPLGVVAPPDYTIHTIVPQSLCIAFRADQGERLAKTKKQKMSRSTQEALSSENRTELT